MRQNRFEPYVNARGLRRADAARYVGISPSKFDQARKAGLIPAPKVLCGVTVYDRHDLDRLFDDFVETHVAANDNDEWELAMRQHGVIA